MPLQKYSVFCLTEPCSLPAQCCHRLWPWTGFNIVGPKFIPIVWPWSHLDRLQVTGVHGWPAVPDAVKESTRIAAANLFRRKDAPFGVAGFGEFALRLTQQDPTVMGLLHRYIRGDRVGV